VNAAQHLLILGVRCYRWVISPAKAFLFGPLGRCRFTPCCSEYALEALGRHGAAAGSWLAMKRIGRCLGCRIADGYAYPHPVVLRKGSVFPNGFGVHDALPHDTGAEAEI
jgi:putative membrane protein insertion efficiency factor